MKLPEIDLKKILTDLSSATGLSGYEHEIAGVTEKYLRPYVDDIRFDTNGNLLSFKKGVGKNGKRCRIYISAHMDEIGLMVTEVNKHGFIRFTTIGGFDPRALIGQPVVVHGCEDYYGVIGPPPYLLSREDARKVMDLEDMYIDVALPANQAGKMIRTGDRITMAVEPLEFKRGDFFSGKALDDRAGVAALIVCAAGLAEVKHQADLFLVATVQEEVGTRGAITSVYGVEPDLGIALDVCHGSMPGVAMYETFNLGKGISIAVGPNIHPTLATRLQETAKNLRIPFGIEPEQGPTGTDARAIQVSREGVPAALIGIPLRYMHTTVETVCISDIKLAASLLVGFVSGADGALLEKIINEYA